ncbi:hypothetical protein ABW20_dc0103676 [Dactylellina cionopaga]|nr:hypothetical protein ABW20_dc0103676 [Dactylellina cionopaga]
MSGAKRRSDEPSSELKPITTDDRRWKRKKTSQNPQSTSVQRFNGTVEEVLLEDVKSLLRTSRPATLESSPDISLDQSCSSSSSSSPPQLFSQVELSIKILSSTGDGLAVSQDGLRVYVVPFSVPGDRVLAKVVRNFPTYSTTDLLGVLTSSEVRHDNLVFCKYFGRCSGCQFQMLSDDYQIEHKKQVIGKAMKNFSNLEASLIPPIGEIMASPLSRGYRTKLTPHFDGPRRGGFKKDAPVPDIGFQVKGRNFVLDIEDCPIGTQAVRDGLKVQREYVKHNLQTYKRGATLLLRESTQRIALPPDDDGNNAIPHKDLKSCVTDSKAMVTEWIGSFKFISPAGAFFQNNNSILETFTSFVSEQLDIPGILSEQGHPPDSYLIDAYCGSGLFSICCGYKFKGILGVDIAAQSIESARKNAEENGIHNARFITGSAEAIFADVDFPPERTSVIIDPPRKGCDSLFLSQLLQLGPKRIVYISCNVHTMARDIGWLLQQSTGKDYVIEKIGGFDFFPQTHHVEGYAVISKSNQDTV